MATMPGPQTRVDWQPQPAMSWQSDVALAYVAFWGVVVWIMYRKRVFIGI